MKRIKRKEIFFFYFFGREKKRSDLQTAMAMATLTVTVTTDADDFVVKSNHNLPLSIMKAPSSSYGPNIQTNEPEKKNIETTELITFYPNGFTV